jgi:hypothetical protein
MRKKMNKYFLGLFFIVISANTISISEAKVPIKTIFNATAKGTKVSLAAKSYKVASSSKVGSFTKVTSEASSAKNVWNGVNLNKSLASQAQMRETGKSMAGAGSSEKFDNAERVAEIYGGKATDWSKKSSSSHTAPDGKTFQTHWGENITTGLRVEFKTKFIGGE